MIVTYHALARPASPVAAPPDRLETDLLSLADAGFTFVSLDQLADRIERGDVLPPRSAVITFDDGYASVVTEGLPLLRRLRVPATVFVIAGRIGGDNQWPGQTIAVRPMPLAGLSELRDLVSAGVTLGSHSWSHPHLPALPSEALLKEINESADRIEQALQTPVRHFAYPYGERGDREIAATRLRYRTAVNAVSRQVHAGADLHDLHRLDCHDLRVAARLRLLGSPLMPTYLAARRAARGARRTLEHAVHG